MARVTKLLATAAAVATVMGMASVANAAIAPSVSGNIDYNADVAATPSVTCELNVGNVCTGGVTVVPGALSFFQTGPNGAQGAVPPNDNTQFLTVMGAGTATLNAAVGTVLTGLSFYMGSPDTFNMVTFFSGANQVGPVFNGGFGGPGDGNQAYGQRVTFNGILASDNITSVRFTSSSTAFELDRINVTSAPVPEPATWAMMILGMGMVGFGLRMRRRMGALA